MNLGENPTLKEEVQPDSELKTWLINYVGDKTEPENGQITVENIVEVMAKEFPDFLMAIAEENWIRGYHQALIDVEEGKKIHEREKIRNSVTDITDITDEQWTQEYNEHKKGE